MRETSANIDKSAILRRRQRSLTLAAVRVRKALGTDFALLPNQSERDQPANAQKANALKERHHGSESRCSRKEA